MTLVARKKKVMRLEHRRQKLDVRIRHMESSKLETLTPKQKRKKKSRLEKLKKKYRIIQRKLITATKQMLIARRSQKLPQSPPKDYGNKIAIISSFTPEEFNEINHAAQRTFEYIAGDFFGLIRDAEGRDYAKQAEVIEMVIDANRMSTHGGLRKDLEDRLYAMDTKTQNMIMKKIFSTKRYYS